MRINNGGSMRDRKFMIVREDGNQSAGGVSQFFQFSAALRQIGSFNAQEASGTGLAHSERALT
jgi:uncharacterized protein YcbX